MLVCLSPFSFAFQSPFRFVALLHCYLLFSEVSWNIIEGFYILAFAFAFAFAFGSRIWTPKTEFLRILYSLCIPSLPTVEVLAVHFFIFTSRV